MSSSVVWWALFTGGDEWGTAEEKNRQQVALFSAMLDDLVAHDSLVRVVDAWVNRVDMKALHFAKAQARAIGAPPYDPADLLKLYIWN